MRVPAVISLVLLLAGCTVGDASESDGSMTSRLAEVAQAERDVRNVYANRARALYFDSLRAREPDSLKQFDYRFRGAVEWMRTGYSERAVQELRDLYRDIDASPSLSAAQKFSLIRQIYPYMGTAYMRLGEQENCLRSHTAASCIFPISEDGVYEMTRGPKAAVTIYRSLLAQEPDHLRSRWLLNVAHMTLGQYPEAVPEDALIPPEAFASEYPLERFVDVAPQSGLAARGLAGGGIVDDFTGDGLLDVMASSWGLRDTLRFFVNQGDGRFDERSREAGLSGQLGGLNLAHADYNNDGHLDVLVLRGGWFGTAGTHPNSLLKNNGDGTFTDVTEAAGILSFHPTQTAAWSDLDGDGLLDLFIGNETVDPLQPHPCELYLNRGDGTFIEVAAAAGASVEAYVKGVAAGDYDNDGRPDLYLSVYDAPNRLLRNAGTNGSGTPLFDDVTESAGVAEPALSFPTWFFDYDQDGWQDLFVADFELDPAVSITHHVAAEYLGRPTERSTARLYRNRGDGSFEDVTEATRLNRITQAMGSNYGDLDGDGWLDLYLGTGDPNLDALIPNLMLRNAEGRHFQDVTSAGGFGHLQKGHSVSFADVDNDGDQDVHAVMGGAYEGDVYGNVLFENPGAPDHHWIHLELLGREANRAAIGSRVRIAAGGRVLYRTVGSGSSFGGNPLRLEIGLGSADRVDTLQIDWAGSGTRQLFTRLASDQHLRIIEGKSVPRAVVPTPFAFVGAPARPHGE